MSRGVLSQVEKEKNRWALGLRRVFVVGGTSGVRVHHSRKEVVRKMVEEREWQLAFLEEEHQTLPGVQSTNPPDGVENKRTLKEGCFGLTGHILTSIYARGPRGYRGKVIELVLPSEYKSPSR